MGAGVAVTARVTSLHSTSQPVLVKLQGVDTNLAAVEYDIQLNYYHGRGESLVFNLGWDWFSFVVLRPRYPLSLGHRPISLEGNCEKVVQENTPLFKYSPKPSGQTLGSGKQIRANLIVRGVEGSVEITGPTSIIVELVVYNDDADGDNDVDELFSSSDVFLFTQKGLLSRMVTTELFTVIHEGSNYARIIVDTPRKIYTDETPINCITNGMPIGEGVLINTSCLNSSVLKSYCDPKRRRQVKDAEENNSGNYKDKLLKFALTSCALFPFHQPVLVKLDNLSLSTPSIQYNVDIDGFTGRGTSRVIRCQDTFAFIHLAPKGKGEKKEVSKNSDTKSDSSRTPKVGQRSKLESMLADKGEEIGLITYKRKDVVILADNSSVAGGITEDTSGQASNDIEKTLLVGMYVIGFDTEKQAIISNNPISVLGKISP